MTNRSFCILAAGILAVVALNASPSIGAFGAPPAVDGKLLYKQQCAVCHGTSGEGSLGPDIRGIVGKKAAAQPDFAYSAALKRSGKVWSSAELANFLLKPAASVPGTRMAYPGAGTTERAAALTAYVATLR